MLLQVGCRGSGDPAGGESDPSIAQTIITHRYPIQDARETFRVASDRAAGAIKVVLHP